MIKSTFDLVVVVGAAVMLPLIVGANLNIRQSGLMAYLWRERPWLPWTGVAFLGLIWLTAVEELATYSSLLTETADATISSVLGMPMLVMALAILAMTAIELARYLRSRRGA